MKKSGKSRKGFAASDLQPVVFRQQAVVKAGPVGGVMTVVRGRNDSNSRFHDIRGTGESKAFWRPVGVSRLVLQ